jgi:serine protease
MARKVSQTPAQQAKPPKPQDPEAERYIPRVIVKFRRELPSYEDDLGETLEKLGIGPWSELEENFHGIRLTKLYTSVSPEEIRALRDRAGQADLPYPLPNLLTYFAIECPEDIDPEALVEELSSQKWQPGIEMAYIEGMPGPPPAFPPTHNPNPPMQGYLDPATVGIGAASAWPHIGPGGADKIGFVDVERGWNLNHQDLAATQIGGPIWGSNSPNYCPHGTSALGVVVAVGNATAGAGVAPHISARVSSELRSPTAKPTLQGIHDAILKAVDSSGPGDVVLIEAQRRPYGSKKNWPVEVEPHIFVVIQTATRAGVVIVEAAGNNDDDGLSFDDLPQQPGPARDWVRNLATPAGDSGAILVAAASSAEPHERLWFSNFGGRVDCYAWGENIHTATTDKDCGANNLYTDSFDGTSGASAIVTGTALLVQCVAKTTFNKTYQKFGELRGILRAHGTTSPHAIGVMPDLAKIIGNLPQPLP